MRTITAFAILLGVAGVLSPRESPAQGSDEAYALYRRIQTGDRVSVVEHQETRTTYHFRRTGEGAVGGQEVEIKHREYVEEVIEIAEAQDGVGWQREYSVATVSKARPGEREPTVLATSLQGKTVVIALGGAGERHVVCLNGEIADDDRNDTNLDRIVYATLPDHPVRRGDSWQLDSAEFGRAIFDGAYDPQNFTSDGIARFRRIQEAEGRRCARIEVRLAIGMQIARGRPGMEIRLDGVVLFAIEEGRIISFELTGPVTVEMLEGDGPNPAHITGNGTTLIRYHAEILD